MFTNKCQKNPVPELAVAALTAATLRKYLHSNRNRFSRYLDYSASLVRENHRRVCKQSFGSAKVKS